MLKKANIATVPKCKVTEGLGSMLPREILEFRPSEIARNRYFSIHFGIFKVLSRATKLHEKGHFTRSFESREGTCPCAPRPYVHSK